MNEVPVVVLDHLTEAQRRAYIIADNRLALDAGLVDTLRGGPFTGDEQRAFPRASPRPLGGGCNAGRAWGIRVDLFTRAGFVQRCEEGTPGADRGARNAGFRGRGAAQCTLEIARV